MCVCKDQHVILDKGWYKPQPNVWVREMTYCRRHKHVNAYGERWESQHSAYKAGIKMGGRGNGYKVMYARSARLARRLNLLLSEGNDNER